MPRLDDIGKIHGFHVRGDDGLVHTVQRQDPPKGRRTMHNEANGDDPRVCLECPVPAELCEGERKCYLQRKKEMEEQAKKKKKKKKKKGGG